MKTIKDDLKKLSEEIKQPLENFDIKKLILTTEPPFEWALNGKHPVEKYGWFFFGVYDGFKWDKDAVQHGDELELWKLFALMQNYWEINNSSWLNKQLNIVYNLNNNIIIKQEDVGKSAWEVYQEYFPDKE